MELYFYVCLHGVQKDKFTFNFYLTSESEFTRLKSRHGQVTELDNAGLRPYGLVTKEKLTVVSTGSVRIREALSPNVGVLTGFP